MNSDNEFIAFVLGADLPDEEITQKHLAGKHDQSRHGNRVGGEATPAQISARHRAASERSSDKAEEAIGARQSPKSNGQANASASMHADSVARGLQARFKPRASDARATWREASGEYGDTLEMLNDIHETISGKRWPATGWDKAKTAPEGLQIAKSNIESRVTEIRDWMRNNRESDYSSYIAKKFDDIDQIWNGGSSAVSKRGGVDLGIRQSPAAPAVQQGGWKTGSNYISKKVGDTMATIYTRGGKESAVVIASKGINTTFRHGDHLGDAKALADAALRGEFDHPIIKADFDGLVKNYGLTNSYGPMKRDEWDRFKLGIATSRSQLISKYRHGMDEISTVNPKSIGIGTAVIPKTGLFKGVPMRIKGFGGKDMRIDPFSGLPYGKANYYIATLYGSDGGDRFSQTAWRGLDTGIEIKIPTSDI